MNKLIIVFASLMLFAGVSQAQMTKKETAEFVNANSLKSVKKVMIVYNSNMYKFNNTWQNSEYEYKQISSISVKHNDNSMVFEVNQRRYLIPYRSIKGRE